MTEREQVIEELSNVIRDAGYPDVPKGFMMPYKLACDTLSLLKAQEPRVMTLEEVLESEEEYWLDGINGACGYGDVTADSNFDYAFYGAHSTRYVDLDAYGKTWRCWTSRPTDAQREAVNWD